MIVWLKFIHIAGLTVWAAGLIAMPGIYLQRTGLPGDKQLFRLHRLALFTYVLVTCPAAFVAVGSGTALVFANQVHAPWFALKLAAVGGMVLLHMYTGYLLPRLFQRHLSLARWRAVSVLLGTLAMVGAILWLVLAKPTTSFARLPDWLTRPGGLQSLLDIRIPIP
jgi:uncharacterized membrane protein